MEIWENIIITTTINNKRSIAKHAMVVMRKTQFILARSLTVSAHSAVDDLDLYLTSKLLKCPQLEVRNTWRSLIPLLASITATGLMLSSPLITEYNEVSRYFFVWSRSIYHATYCHLYHIHFEFHKAQVFAHLHYTCLSGHSREYQSVHMPQQLLDLVCTTLLLDLYYM